LYKYGEELDDIYPWDEAIDMFFEWLDDNFPDGVILVAHGAFQNDARILIKNLKKSGWGDEQIENVILGFCDTIISFQKGFTGECQYSGSVYPITINGLLEWFHVHSRLELNWKNHKWESSRNKCVLTLQFFTQPKNWINIKQAPS
jgi:hypothetical protein